MPDLFSNIAVLGHNVPRYFENSSLPPEITLKGYLTGADQYFWSRVPIKHSSNN